MKIDWKKLAQSPGYKSLKAAYIRDVREAANRKDSVQKKKEFLRLFRKVINMAQHRAIRLDISVEQVLNEWENIRDHWWLNYYSDYHLKKLPSGKPRNVKPQRPETYWRKDNWYSPVDRFKQTRKEKTRLAKFNREHVDGKKKPRWHSERKHRARNIRALHERQKRSL